MSAVFGDLHHLSWYVLGSGEVNEVLSAELLAKISFGITAIDGDHPHAHRFGILNAEVPEATSRSWKDDPLSWLDVRAFACRISSDTLTR